MEEFTPTHALGRLQAHALMLLADGKEWTAQMSYAPQMRALQRRGLVEWSADRWQLTSEGGLAAAERRVLRAEEALDRAKRQLVEAAAVAGR